MSTRITQNGALPPELCRCHRSSANDTDRMTDMFTLLRYRLGRVQSVRSLTLEAYTQISAALSRTGDRHVACILRSSAHAAQLVAPKRRLDVDLDQSVGDVAKPIHG